MKAAVRVHGLFDFWLINEQVNFLALLSIIMVILGLSAWNSIINNSLNFSMPEKESKQGISHSRLQDYLIYSLSGVLILEYFLVSINEGAERGTSGLFGSVRSGAYLIFFISTSLSHYKLVKRYKFGLFDRKKKLNT